MIAQGSGHIVNISSAAGLVPSSMRIPYTTAKHGVVGLSTHCVPKPKAMASR
ncbi:SDR family NAD(P)-dependent oxidoreductase [Methanosarcina horonobensis]|uniref:SDR family NAD(P)-dependent oxidoreductase n=1 Tax=Methanosarcina horonobensis TaxID=418008 RepID=UPI00373FC8BE